jgi:tetratricopeptide (TPR) repeat protein
MGLMTAARDRDAAKSDLDVMATLRQGMELFGQGRLSEAEFSFMAVLATDEGCFEALQFLAIVRIRQGRQLEALDLVRRALKQRRRAPEALALQGTLLSNLDRNEEALVSFDKFLALKPDHVETLYNRGVALAKLGREADAIESYRMALTHRPGHALAQFNLANTLAKSKDHDQALAAYDLLLARAGAEADVLNNRGNVLYELGRFEDAIADYDKGLAERAGHLELWKNRGRAFKALGRHDEVIACCDRILALVPARVDALNERGGALVELGHFNEALASFDTALALDGSNVDAINNRCAALQRLGRFEDALAEADRALALDPRNALAYFGRGNALQSLDRFELAVDCYRTSLTLQPGVPNVHKNLGGALQVLERDEEALAQFEQALALGAKDDETQASKSLVYLSLGQFDKGWEHYDSRLADKMIVRRDYAQPRWDGEHVPGTLLIWGEQGLGDQIIYASMMPDLAGRAETVVIEVEPRLVSLFARSFPGSHVVAIGEGLYAGEVDAHEPIGSLGRYLRPSWDAFTPREGGYLVPDLARASQLRDRLKGDGRRVVGLSWKSQNPKFEKAKSARLADFEPVLRLPGCRFIDLQYGNTRADLDAVERELGVHVEHLDDIDNKNDIEGLAALMAACDVVVTVSNTTAHLAGALGRPTFVFVPYGHARLWYWFKERDDSPWYPRLRVKRQLSGQSWAELIAANIDELSTPTREN